MCADRARGHARYVIEVQHLTKSYGPARAVDDLSFVVRPGKVTGFLGPNGAGKSTTLRLLLGLGEPDAGRALLFGKPYRELSDPLLRVGGLLEAGSTQRTRSAYHHLLWLAHTHRIPRSRVREVLEMVGLSDVAARASGGFSLGMSQRLGIAAALLGDPEVLLLDEPVNGLDPEGVHWLRNLLKERAAAGRTVLLSSHLMNEMAVTADHLVVIGRGRLLSDSSLADFTAEHCRSVVRVRAHEPERLRALLRESGAVAEIEPDGTLRVTGMESREVAKLARAHDIGFDELAGESTSLEEAFLEMTARETQFTAGSGFGLRGGAGHGVL
ncbi:ATP-binding cassette domain-containing protein [Streptomyces sp. 891-h]|nr:ATP-binding cassette domain-containing protein [Streptomyces sp. 891-h]